MYISFFILSYLFLPDSFLAFLSHHITITHLFHPHKLAIDSLSFLYSCKWVHCIAVSTFGSWKAVCLGLFPSTCETARMLELKLLSTRPGHVDLWSASWGSLRLQTWAMVARNCSPHHILVIVYVAFWHSLMPKQMSQTHLPSRYIIWPFLTGYPFHFSRPPQPLLLFAPCFQVLLPWEAGCWRGYQQNLRSKNLALSLSS